MNNNVSQITTATNPNTVSVGSVLPNSTVEETDQPTSKELIPIPFIVISLFLAHKIVPVQKIILAQKIIPAQKILPEQLFTKLWYFRFLFIHVEYTSKDIDLLYLNGELLMKKRTNYRQKKAGAAITSDVWEKFHILSLKETNEIIKDWVQCSKCSKFLKYNGRTTTGLKRHICSFNDNMSSTLDSFLSIGTLRFTETNKKIIRDGAEKFIVLDLRPYFALEGDGLRSFLRAAIQISKRYPSITEEDIDKLIPSRRTMNRHIDEKANTTVNSIKADFKKAIETVGGFSCTADLYSDKYKQKCYLGITAKLNIFENDCIIQKEHVIHLNELKYAKKNADNIEQEIDKIFAEYDITKDQIRENITWTTDRGWNIRNALSAGVRYNCFAHMSNNIVDTMCQIPVIKQMISNAASLVRYMKKSGLSNDERLQRALQSFIETRWNTVYYLFQSILDNYNAILEILMDKEKLSKQTNLIVKLTCLPKSEMKDIANFIHFFIKITINVQGDKYETLHLVWPYTTQIHKHLMANAEDSDLVAQMKAEGRQYLLKPKNIDDFKPKLGHKIAVFLHPAMKNLNSVSEQDKIEIIDHIKLKMSLNYNNQTVPQTDNIAVQQIEPVVVDDFFGEFLGSNSNINNTTTNVVNYLAEIDNYMNFTVPTVIKFIEKFNRQIIQYLFILL